MGPFRRQPPAMGFYVVKSPKVKQELIAAAKGQTFIAEAAIVIGVVAVTARSAERYGERGENSMRCRIRCRCANCLLLAKSMGLGSCWIGAFKEDEVAQVLGLPEGHRPVALIPIGHPAEEPAPRPKNGAQRGCHNHRLTNKKHACFPLFSAILLT